MLSLRSRHFLAHCRSSRCQWVGTSSLWNMTRWPLHANNSYMFNSFTMQRRTFVTNRRIRRRRKTKRQNRKLMEMVELSPRSESSRLQQRITKGLSGKVSVSQLTEVFFVCCTYRYCPLLDLADVTKSPISSSWWITAPYRTYWWIISTDQNNLLCRSLECSSRRLCGMCPSVFIFVGVAIACWWYWWIH